MLGTFVPLPVVFLTITVNFYSLSLIEPVKISALVVISIDVNITTMSRWFIRFPVALIARAIILNQQTPTFFDYIIEKSFPRVKSPIPHRKLFFFPVTQG